VRCFIALPLPGHAREALARALSPLRGRWPRLSWTAPESWHLTLAFLGEVGEGALGCALRAIEAAAAPGGAAAAPESAVAAPSAARFAFSFSRLEYLPPRGAPRVLYADLAERPAGASAAVWRRVNEALAEEGRRAGLPPLNAEWGPLGRPFRAHVTLARTRQGALGPGRAALAGFGLPEGSWTIDRCVVYKSDLRPGGSVYTELRSVELPIPRPQAPGPVPRV